MPCIFCEIVAGRAPCHKLWEDDEHIAFLSIFPNTRGFSVVTTKKHYPSYAFKLPDEVLAKLTVATKKLALILDRALDDVGRTAMIFEGYGVDHVHAKLFPMHGTGNSSEFKPFASKVDKFFHQYEGYVSSHDWQRADDADLATLAEHIRKSQAAA
jgi:histidine triad (HIT) family protein